MSTIIETFSIPNKQHTMLHTRRQNLGTLIGRAQVFARYTARPDDFALWGACRGLFARLGERIPVLHIVQRLGGEAAQVRGNGPGLAGLLGRRVERGLAGDWWSFLGGADVTGRLPRQAGGAGRRRGVAPLQGAVRVLAGQLKLKSGW